MRLAAGRSCSTLFSPAVHRAGHKKGAIGSERKKFSNVGGLRGRQKAPATCATAARCSPLSLSLSVLSAYSGTSFVVKLEGPQAVTYADTLRVIREPP